MAAVERKYYLGQRSPGKVAAPFAGHRIYYKPAIGKIVFRTAGVMRRSPRVVAINERLAAAPVKPATKCKGRPWKEFIECLRREMKATIGGAAPAWIPPRVTPKEVVT
ncbi:MAG: hypothetical protein QW503_04665 [Sulfolobales archaeon]